MQQSKISLNYHIAMDGQRLCKDCSHCVQHQLVERTHAGEWIPWRHAGRCTLIGIGGDRANDISPERGTCDYYSHRKAPQPVQEGLFDAN